jgi:hypothetical protein
MAGGSGGGANQTALAESAVCIATAWLMLTGKDLTKKDLSDSKSVKKIITNINKIADIGKLDTKKGIKQVLEFLQKDEAWLSTTVRTATKIKKEKIGSKKDYHFHRDSQFMNDIYKTASSHIKKINKLGLRIDPNKWNPGDIWLARGSGRDGFPATKDLTSLNKSVLKKFKECEIVGISLKKLSSSGAGTWTVYNLPKQQRAFIFDKIEKPAGLLMNSKDVYITAKSGMKIQIRTFDAYQDIQCQITGGHAAGGKAGFGVTKHAIETLTKESLMTWKEVHKLSKPKQIKLIRKFHALCKIGATPSVQAIEKNIKQQKNKNGILFDKWPDKRKDDYYISKIQALQIASIIKSSKNKNEIISVIFAYAASLGLKDLFEASVYAKIY